MINCIEAKKYWVAEARANIARARKTPEREERLRLLASASEKRRVAEYWSRPPQWLADSR